MVWLRLWCQWWNEPVFQSAVKGRVDGLGVRVKRNEQALTATGQEWMADCFIEIGKSGGMCKSRALPCLVSGQFMEERVTSRSVLTAVPVSLGYETHVRTSWGILPLTLATVSWTHLPVLFSWFDFVLFLEKIICLFHIIQLFYLNVSYFRVSVLASTSWFVLPFNWKSPKKHHHPEHSFSMFLGGKFTYYNVEALSKFSQLLLSSANVILNKKSSFVPSTNLNESLV